ncbi:hypothetical protein IFO69_08970 [Echinicola sp. CAU 1574]|uniref:DUF5689 domain-containing protein n=1 Tax=Echinicola arenosa TaxID=2774144 RepID=A0ABR9AK08_9BACT|nr:DUF5689 domain-containing protein [Echinicola arenosa]MBD8488874.1 hypothetical protein [Echinicola arenosa]
MKTKIFLLPIVALGLGCADTDDQPYEVITKNELNFSATSKTMMSYDDPAEVLVSFNSPLTEDASFNIKLTGEAIYAQHFTTYPEAVDGIINIKVQKGRSSSSFLVLPLEKPGDSGSKSVYFSLDELSEKLVAGKKNKFALKILQMDPSSENELAIVSFESNTLEMKENFAAGMEVVLPIVGEVIQSGKVTLQLNSSPGMVYGKDFYTYPAFIQNEMMLDIYPGSERLQFQVYPINDRVLEGGFTVYFELVSTTDGVILGEEKQLEVLIEEDDLIDPSMIHSIADLRAEFDGHEGEWHISEDYYVEGVVTSSENVTNEKTIYIQDQTGGIMLVFHLEKLLKQGDKVQLNLKDASGKIIDGQKAIHGVIDRLGIQLGEMVDVPAETISLEQLGSGHYQGKKVRIEDVRFKTANGVITWNGAKQIESIKAGTGGTVFTHERAEFALQILPSVKVTLVGIVGPWNRLQIQNYSLDVIK